jgi:hypothetical protein
VSLKLFGSMISRLAVCSVRTAYTALTLSTFNFKIARDVLYIQYISILNLKGYYSLEINNVVKGL